MADARMMREAPAVDSGRTLRAIRGVPGALQAVAMVVWPFIVIVGSRGIGARWTAVAVLLVLVPGLVRRGRGAQGVLGRRVALAVGAAAMAIPAAILDDARFLMAWPVLVSVGLLAAFLLSLRGGRSVVEGFARLQKPELTPSEVAYCRAVTLVWCAFFVGNGAVAAALAVWGRREVWALYTGAGAYVLMGLLFAIEYGVRRVRFPPAPKAAP